MKKNQYIAPSVEVHALEAENMMAASDISVYNSSARKDCDVLTNERDGAFTDIWGN